jgi:hypothetical protein
MKGFVYILSNPSMPGLVKIGRTTRSVEGRANELYQTGVPTPFVVERQVLTPDCEALESEVHNALADCRVNGSREFFRVSVPGAEFALETSHTQIVEEWLGEFMPDHVAVEIDLAPDYPHLSRLSAELDSHFMEVVSAMQMLEADELLPALGRWRERVGLQRAQMARTAEVIRLG